MLDVKKLLAKVLQAISALSADSGVISVYNDYCKARKVGKCVFIQGVSTNFMLPQRRYRDLATLPEGFRPSQQIYMACGAMGGGAQITGTIGTNGAIRLYSTEETSYWTICVMFMVA